MFSDYYYVPTDLEKGTSSSHNNVSWYERNSYGSDDVLHFSGTLYDRPVSRQVFELFALDIFSEKMKFLDGRHRFRCRHNLLKLSMNSFLRDSNNVFLSGGRV